MQYIAINALLSTKPCHEPPTKRANCGQHKVGCNLNGFNHKHIIVGTTRVCTFTFQKIVDVQFIKKVLKHRMLPNKKV